MNDDGHLIKIKEIASEVREMYRRMREYAQSHGPIYETAMDFNERDLFRLAERCRLGRHRLASPNSMVGVSKR